MHTHCGYPAELTSELALALKGADAAFIITDHTAYKSLTPKDFSGMNTPLLIDTRRMIDVPAFNQSGFTVISVGVGIRVNT
jgi:UDP-N-acetyl-D-mannosaminuronate dehydrogenase